MPHRRRRRVGARLAVAIVLLCGTLPSLVPSRAQAEETPIDAARRLYAEFVAAQNAHDFDRVRATLLDSERFLWVTNGLSIWGRETAVRRMSGYHTAQVWRITPDAARARAVEAGPDTAFLHLPLVLEIGDRDGPDHFRFLVSALCVRTPEQGWRFAALFTTIANPEGANPEGANPEGANPEGANPEGD
jgi:ketosteroid isomerase-like protein